MKKRITIFLAIGLMALGLMAQDREHVLRLSDFMKPKGLALPAFVAGQYLTNDGTALSWGALDLSPYIRRDGTTPLTADWNVGAFDLTCVDMNATYFRASNGVAATPSIAFTNYSSTGFYVDSAYGGAGLALVFSTAGTAKAYLNAGGFSLNPGYAFGWSNSSILKSDNPNQIQLGTDAASPVDQTLKACDGSGTDKAGAMLTLSGGQSTGTGNPGGYRVQTSTVAGTGSTANTYYTRFHVVGKVYSLADNTATDIFSIACADGNGVGGKIDYTVEVTDGTDLHVESGTVHFAGVNKATETWTSSVAEVSTQAISNSGGGGSLATTWAVDTATADTFKITLNSNSSLTPTSTLLRYQITLNSPRVITIL